MGARRNEEVAWESIRKATIGPRSPSPDENYIVETESRRLPLPIRDPRP